MFDDIFPSQCKYFCYIIRSENRTYNGYTIDLHRRLRQHNREIAGGAKSTQGRTWEYLAVVSSPDWTKQDAMKVEWHIRYPTRKKPRPREFCGVQGRLASLDLITSQNMVVWKAI
jgi:predicted GIY-YIG superfamily endonuclease